MHLVYINCYRLCSTVPRINQKLSCLNLDVWNVGSLGLNYFGFFDDGLFDEFFDNSSNFVNFVNFENTNHVLNTNHPSVVQSSGHLAGIVIAVVAITPTIALATYLILRGRWFKKHGYPTARAFSPPGVNIQSERPDLSEKLLSRMLRSFHAGLMAVIIRLKGEQTRVLDDRGNGHSDGHLAAEGVVWCDHTSTYLAESNQEHQLSIL